MSELLTRTSFGQFGSRPADISLAQFGLPRPLLPESSTGGLGLPGLEEPLLPPAMVPPASPFGGLGQLAPDEMRALLLGRGRGRFEGGRFQLL